MDQNLCYHLAFLLCILILTKIFLRRKKNLPPCPFALPVIGHIHLLSDPVYKSLQTLSKKYGRVMSLKLGSRSVIVVSSPSAMEECITKNDVVFANRPVPRHYGHYWRTLRRQTVVEIFSPKGIRKYSSTIQEEVRSLLCRLHKVSSLGTQQKVDLNFLIGVLVTNTSMRIAFGKRCLGDKEAETEVEKEWLEEFKRMAFPSLMMQICDYIPILRLIGYGGIEKNMKKAQKKRDEYFQNLFDDIRLKRKRSRLDETSSGSQGNRSVAEVLMDMQESDPNLYSDEIVKSTSIMMIVAGNEVISSTLEWAMSLLLNHPVKMQKLRAEIDSQVGKDCLSNESDNDKLPYIRCVINETLRLYPPLPLSVPHLSSESCTVEGFEIPRGTMLMANTWALHRDPELWSEPNEFKPERFEAVSGKRKSLKFLPFGMGRRVCPGAGLGMHILSLTLGALIQCFDWDKVGVQEDMKECFKFSLTKAKPLEALCTPRLDVIKFLSH
ncbi:hypothetical protein Tsubulata_044198, partial [Turnera subulata]